MKKLLFALLALFALVACENGGGIKRPSASGRPYELLVVMEQGPWDGPTGDVLKAALQAPIEGLPQDEPMFKLSRVSAKSFDRSCQMFRNILIIDIDPSIYSKVSLKFSRDEYADGQVMMRLSAPSQRAVYDYMQQYPETVTDFFCHEELVRTAQLLKGDHNATVEKQVADMFGCKIYVPIEVERSKVGENFLWASTRSLDKNLVFYTYPYEGPETFNKDYILAKRDSVMKVNIEGREYDREDGEHIKSWMATNHEFTDVKVISMDGGYCMEARGLWEMENDFMGGPFVSHSRVDTINNVVVVAEGFVMEFKEPNGKYMRRLEGSLYSLHLPKQPTNE